MQPCRILLSQFVDGSGSVTGLIDLHSEVRMDVERYSGAQVWYPKDDTGALHGQFFD